ncbi:uncharacterized protein LOC126970932 [Leptidea sinapis]|uniref:uncharacterized protein LOC126970932 n=1 Tax=Leptidea sinapis TaxID=189913 RepID=UPI0021C4AE58|nr:uncharacterized protein LOC126970932 [Leptidea sinapis]
MVNFLVFGAVFTLIQAVFQIVFAALALAQYYCLINFMKSIPILLYVRMLYYHHPERCGEIINIGQSVEELNNQAIVFISREPLTVTRTFYINIIYVTLGVLWAISSAILMWSARHRTPIRWPWTMMTIAVCSADIVVSILFTNDTFHTRTLRDIIDYIGATLSGAGNTEIRTVWAAWLMAILFSKFVFLIFFNIGLVIAISLWKPNEYIDRAITVETPYKELTPRNSIIESAISEATLSSVGAPTMDGMDLSLPSIPRPQLRRQANIEATEIEQTVSQFQPTVESPRKTRRIEEKHVLSFNEVPVIIPNELDTSQVTNAFSEELPNQVNNRDESLQIQGQLPWTYLPSKVHPMRKQIDVDEELPPVPLPDYTALQIRKASVHRSPSTVIGLTSGTRSKLRQNALKQTDVYY